MAKVFVKNWAEFQHYKDRSPPWIKLHKTLLDNYEYQSLQIASKALAPMFWLLASENMDGCFEDDLVKLEFRLRTPKKIVGEALSELINKGFFIADSDTLADCKQVAMPETEERRGEKRQKPASAVSLPADFSLTDDLREWAKDKGHTQLEKRLEHFVGYAKANGKKYADWTQAFQNAVRDDWAKLGKGSDVNPFAGIK